MIQYLLRNVDKYPHRPFIIYNEKTYSNEEFLFQVQHTSRVLKYHDIKKKSLVGIYLNDPFEFLIHWFACNYLGLISVLLNSKLKNIELNKFIESVNLKDIITSRNSTNIEKSNSLNLILIEDSPSLSSCGDSFDIENWNIYETFTIIFTSGSDGRPKPVELSIHNFLSSFKNWNNEIQFRADDKIINFLPLHHIAGLSSICRGLLSQTLIIQIQKFQSDEFILSVQKFKPLIVSMVPTVIYKLLQSEKGIHSLKIFRMILVGGGPATDHLLETCLRHNINIFVTYGMTETTSGVSGFWINAHPNKLKSVGKPFLNLTLSTKVKSLNEYSPIIVIGENVANGYLNENRFNSQFISGDLGKYDVDGFLHLKPLREDRIISGGENINPFEVENILNKIPNVLDCCVVGIKDSEWGETIITFIQKKKILSKSEIIDFCQARLLEYKIPKKIYFCNEIPKNELGKINRTQIKKLLKDSEHI
jgi:o-succinylbenzoate---CoA ligase